MAAFMAEFAELSGHYPLMCPVSVRSGRRFRFGLASFLDVQVIENIGVPGGIRTHGPRIRNPVLYPAELRGQRTPCYLPLYPHTTPHRPTACPKNPASNPASGCAWPSASAK